MCDDALNTRGISSVNLFLNFYFFFFYLRNFRDTRTNVVRVSRDGLETTCENLATVWRKNKTKRHSYECRATRTNVARLSYELK